MRFSKSLIFWFVKEQCGWKKFKHLLIEKGMTQKALAEKAGISPNTIRNIKTERISFKNMCKIADALEVSLDELR